VQGSGAVAELAVQDQERQAAEVVAVQVRHQHQPDPVGILPLLLQGDQGGGAAVQQDVAVLAGGVQQDAGLEAAAAAEGVTGADEPHLDESLGHPPTLPCANRPG
jgi:glutamate dehydrogenase/leucine dehydrogenase